MKGAVPMNLKTIAFSLALALACTLNSAEFNLRSYIAERYRAGERVITLPDGDLHIATAPCKLGPEIQDLEIRGGKRTRLIVKPYAELFYLSGCRNVKLSGFAVDHQPLLFTQGTITKIEGNLYHFRLHDGYPRMGKQFLNRHPHFFDRDTRKFKWGNTMKSGDCREIRATGPDSGVIEYTAPVGGIRTGDYVVLSYRKGAAFKIDDFAADLRLEDITVYNAGYGVMSRRSKGNVTVRNFRIVPGPTPAGAVEPRLLATCADAFNFAASRQGPVIENCEVNAIGDDSINLHGTPMPVAALTPAGDPVICLPSPKHHLKLLRPGDTVLVLRPGNYEIKQKVKLKAVRPAEFRDPEVLKKVFPKLKHNSILSFSLELENANVQTGDLLDIPAANCPGFTIRNNRFANHRARGIRLMAGNGIIENNRISHLENCAISIGPEYAYWGESGWADNVTVRGNRIDSVCLGASAWRGGSYTQGAICTFVRTDPKLPVFPGNTNLRIENNTIRNCPLSGIFLTGADNVSVKGNQLINTAYRKDARTGRQFGQKWLPKPAGSFGSRNIRMENNQIRTEVQKPAPDKGDRISETTVYVDNVKGSDANSGKKDSPVASIERGLALLKPSGRMEVTANPGKPYTRPYPGPVGKNFPIRVGGTAEKPVIINGNGAVFSGLSVIPANCWKQESERIVSLPFWPMSNRYKHYDKQDFWMPDLQIWFVDGLPAPNRKSRAEMERTPGGFWWSRKEKKVYFHLPEGKELGALRIELPANAGFYIARDYVTVRNFTVIHSWNDGFDTAESPRRAVYSNCIAIDNCGQGFSCHGTGEAFYEDCIAIRCGSSGACNVDSSLAIYSRCIFYNNVFEAGVFNSDRADSRFYDCLILDNHPFEQATLHRNASFSFFNCVLRADRQDNAVCTLNAGKLLLQNCTVIGGRSLVHFLNKTRGFFHMENSLIGKQKEYLFSISDNADRLFLRNNGYFSTPGIRLRGKTVKELLPGDTGSAWITIPDTSLQHGIPPAELPPSGKRRGASLPVQVWKRFEQYKNASATTTGIVVSALPH